MPVTLIGEAVFARCLSALKSQREYARSGLSSGLSLVRAEAQGGGGGWAEAQRGVTLYPLPLLYPHPREQRPTYMHAYVRT